MAELQHAGSMLLCCFDKADRAKQAADAFLGRFSGGRVEVLDRPPDEDRWRALTPVFGDISNAMNPEEIAGIAGIIEHGGGLVLAKLPYHGDTDAAVAFMETMGPTELPGPPAPPRLLGMLGGLFSILFLSGLFMVVVSRQPVVRSLVPPGALTSSVLALFMTISPAVIFLSALGLLCCSLCGTFVYGIRPRSGVAAGVGGFGGCGGGGSGGCGASGGGC